MDELVTTQERPSLSLRGYGGASFCVPIARELLATFESHVGPMHSWFTVYDASLMCTVTDLLSLTILVILATFRNCSPERDVLN